MAIFVVIGSVVWVGQIASEVNTTRGQLDGLATRVDGLDRDAKAIAVSTATIQRDLREMETQCRAIENGINLMHANDLRGFAVLWEKVYGGVYHTDNVFYPDICRVNN